jgi:hypothetical protein
LSWVVDAWLWLNAIKKDSRASLSWPLSYCFFPALSGASTSFGTQEAISISIRAVNIGLASRTIMVHAQQAMIVHTAVMPPYGQFQFNRSGKRRAELSLTSQ